MCYKYGWVIKGGQKHITTHYEKGARDQNFEAEKRETGSQVERHETPESEALRAESSERNSPGVRSHWFDDKTKEIGNAESDSQAEFRWF